MPVWNPGGGGGGGAASGGSDLQAQARRMGHKAQSMDARDVQAQHGAYVNDRLYAVWVPAAEGIAAGIASISFFLSVSATGVTTAEVGTMSQAGVLLSRGSATAALNAASGKKAITQTNEPGQTTVIAAGVDAGFWALLSLTGSSVGPRLAGWAAAAGPLTAIPGVSLGGYTAPSVNGLVNGFSPAGLVAAFDSDWWCAAS